MGSIANTEQRVTPSLETTDWVHSPEKAKRLQKSGKKRASQPTPSLEMPILEAEASTHMEATQ